MNRKSFEGRAKDALTSEGAASKAAFFFIGAAGTIGGFVLGRRHVGLVLRSTAGRAKSGPDGGTLSDPALATKVESRLFREVDVPGAGIVVTAESGVIFLRGEVERGDQIDAVVVAAARVDGVTAVESLLHLPEIPAPVQS